MSNRPRCIWNPDYFTKVYGGYVNYVYLQCLKKLQPEYCSYLPLEQLESFMGSKISQIKNPISISIDGKSHDSHQHWRLLNAIDVPIVLATFQKLSKYIPLKKD